MALSNLNLRALSRLFEKGDRVRTAKTLCEMAHQGVNNPLGVFFDHPLEDDWMDFAGQSLHEHFKRRKGFVYVVANPIHKHWYKVGMTAGSVEKRLRSLNTAGVIGDFIEIDQAYAFDRFSAEKMSHQTLSLLAQKHKEFFVTNWQTACHAMRESVSRDNAILQKAFGIFL